MNLTCIILHRRKALYLDKPIKQLENRFMIGALNDPIDHKEVRS